MARKRSGGLTAWQRQSVECLEASRREGVALSAYVRGRGLNERAVYDAIARLRRRGVLPRPRAATSAFLALQVVEPEAAPVVASTPTTGLLCTVRCWGLQIDCAQWPPAAWLASLTSGLADAAS